MGSEADPLTLSLSKDEGGSLDTVFSEDNARARKDDAPQNLATIWRLALNIARLHPDKKAHATKIAPRRMGETFFIELIRHTR